MLLTVFQRRKPKPDSQNLDFVVFKSRFFGKGKIIFLEITFQKKPSNSQQFLIVYEYKNNKSLIIQDFFSLHFSDR